MITDRMYLILAAILLLGRATPGRAQLPGTWEGFLELGRVGRLPVEYLVAMEGDELLVTMKTTDGPASPVTDIHWTNDDLLFTWGGFACRLERWTDAYQGDCAIAGDTATAFVSLNVPTPDQRNGSGWADGADVLRAEDLLATSARDMYNAIEALRPRWLLPRGPLKYNRAIHVNIYLDGQPVGDVSFLRGLEVGVVHTARYYSASDATFHFGRANEGGVIALSSIHR
jgi:hypothetical protein